MSDFRAAYRYALALLNVAEEQKKLDETNADLAGIEGLIADSREFAVFLKSPVINHEKKKHALTEILRGKIGDLTFRFVLLMTSKGREALLPEVIQQFHKLRDERLGILQVDAWSAIPFKPDQEQQLSRQLELATKKKVRLTYSLDPSLKGGFIVQHEDTVWDASVRRQLELLRERFMEGAA